MIELSDREFREICGYIRTRYGLDLERKKYLIESKLWIELARSKSDTYTEYWKKLLDDRTGTMERRMMDQLTTNYTFFCREPEHFDFLCRRILPGLPSRRIRPLRIWSAGCATGQECYTLAMMLLDCRRAGTLRVPFSILGTDLSETAVEKARKGCYGSADYARLPQAWQLQYCEAFEDGQFRVKEMLHSCIRFQRQNLLTMPAAAPYYDIIFCRNVLIYFRDREREKLVRKLTDSLTAGGYLMIGHTESLIAIPNRLKYIQPAVYRKPGAKHD
jgi:chemotaxis protein methyltransferase CheR